MEAVLSSAWPSAKLSLSVIWSHLVPTHRGVGNTFLGVGSQSSQANVLEWGDWKSIFILWSEVSDGPSRAIDVSLKRVPNTQCQGCKCEHSFRGRQFPISHALGTQPRCCCEGLDCKFLFSTGIMFQETVVFGWWEMRSLLKSSIRLASVTLALNGVKPVDGLCYIIHHVDFISSTRTNLS